MDDFPKVSSKCLIPFVFLQQCFKRKSMQKTKKKKVFLEGSISITQQFKTGAAVIHLKNQRSPSLFAIC